MAKSLWNLMCMLKIHQEKALILFIFSKLWVQNKTKLLICLLQKSGLTSYSVQTKIKLASQTRILLLSQAMA